MTRRQTGRKRAGEAARTLATGLWLPALLLAGLLFSYLPAFHHPAPHHVSIAVAASRAATARLQHELGAAAPGGFTLRPAAGAAGARAAVLHHSAVAAYVPGGPHPLLYGAKAEAAALETVIRQAFAAVAGRAGGTPAFRELVPGVPGDASGSSLLYVVLSCAVAAYFMVVAMQRAVGFTRRAHVATSIGWGAAAAAAAYLAAAYVVQAIPPHPLDLLYLFLLTQAVSLTAYGLVPLFGGFFPAEDPTVMLPEPAALAPHQHHFDDEEPMLTGQVADPSGQPLPGTTVTVIDPHGRQLVRTRTDQNGEYAATGFSEVAAVVIATTPGRPAAVAQLLLDPATPANQEHRPWRPAPFDPRTRRFGTTRTGDPCWLTGPAAETRKTVLRPDRHRRAARQAWAKIGQRSSTPRRSPGRVEAERCRTTARGPYW